MRVFADTHYFIALLSERDAAHRAASDWEPDRARCEMVTTSWVLLELADGMSTADERQITAEFIEQLRGDPMIRVIPLSEEIQWRGFELYRSRVDKDWSLTDCVSFVVMKQEGIGEALTGDHHFEQAGFAALLK